MRLRLHAISLCLVALLSLAAGVALAWVHPLSPVLAVAAFYAALVLLAFKPGLWLFLVPASLPVLNFFPWSGWRMVEEFDLLLLATLAAGYGRWGWAAWQRAKADAGADASQVAPGPAKSMPLAIKIEAKVVAGAVRGRSGLAIAITLFTVFSVVSALRGFSADGFWQAMTGVGEMGLFQDYVDPLNSLRQFKSLAFALLCLPLLRREFASASPNASTKNDDTRPFAPFARFAAGLLTGLALVVLIVLWERLAYPGPLNFSTRYRTTAMFWEMHVGGAAIDTYWVMCAPFVLWALAASKKLRHWLPLAVLALLTCYGVLTTFSRGVYVAVLLPLLAFWLFRWARRAGIHLRQPVGQLWRRRASVWLCLLLVLEIAIVAAGGSFLMDRLDASKNDLDDRLVHWQRGIGLLESPLDWLIGRGLGRFSAEYAALGPDTEFSGTLRLLNETPTVTQFQAVPAPLLSQNFVRLSGPISNAGIGGMFMLNQRVAVPVAQLLGQSPHQGQSRGLGSRPGAEAASSGVQVQLEVRSKLAAKVMVKICEKHLLYEAECLVRHLRLRGGDDSWQSVTLAMRGEGVRTDGGLGPRPAILTMTVFTPDAQVDLRQFALIDAAGRPLNANTHFSQGLARWFPSAGNYYLPWHIDNLYLELLIERGLAGLVLFVWMVVAAVKRLVSTPPGNAGWRHNGGVIVSTALIGILLLGLVSSVLDAPRVAFLLFLLIFLPIKPGDGNSPS